MIRLNKPLYYDDMHPYSVCGSEIEPEYQLDFKKNGGVYLRKIGERPVYEIIQSNRANCDLESVLQSCVHANQHDVISSDSVNELVADFTTSTNLGDLYNSTKRIENVWHDMPLEVRERFGSDIKQFIRGIGTPDFHENIRSGYETYHNQQSQRKFVAADDVAHNLPNVAPSTSDVNDLEANK